MPLAVAQDVAAARQIRKTRQIVKRRMRARRQKEMRGGGVGGGRFDVGADVFRRLRHEGNCVGVVLEKNREMEEVLGEFPAELLVVEFVDVKRVRLVRASLRSRFDSVSIPGTFPPGAAPAQPRAAAPPSPPDARSPRRRRRRQASCLQRGAASSRPELKRTSGYSACPLRTASAALSRAYTVSRKRRQPGGAVADAAAGVENAFTGNGRFGEGVAPQMLVQQIGGDAARNHPLSGELDHSFLPKLHSRVRRRIFRRTARPMGLRAGPPVRGSIRTPGSIPAP